jgi:hypothetical protein
MSSAPSPKLDPELRWKRSSLAWEIRKFRLQQALDREKFDLEGLRFRRDGKFWVRLGPTMVASFTTVLGALIALYGVSVKQEAAATASEAGTYIRQNAAAITGGVSNQIDQRAKILADNPDSVAKEIFSRLVKQSDSEATRQIWNQGLQLAESSGTTPASATATVYVHYKEPANDAALTAVMQALTKAGYYVPGKQRVVQPTEGDVRYSASPGDSATESSAKNIASLVKQALASVGVKLTLNTINLNATFPKAPATTFEVWLPPMPPGQPAPGSGDSQR